MHFVDRHRRGEGIHCRRGLKLWGELGFIEHDGSGVGPHLRLKCQRIGLQRQLLAMWTDDVELVATTGGDAGNEDFPIAVAAHAHGVRAVVPIIEVADHANALCIRCEHDKGYAAHAFHRHRMGTELIEKLLMATFAEQIEIEIAQLWREAVGVLQLHDVVAIIGAQAISAAALWQCALEQACIVKTRQLGAMPLFIDRLDLRGMRQESAHNIAAVLRMQAEIAERVRMAAFEDRVGFSGESHSATSVSLARMRSAPSSGTLNQSGRCASSYSIS